MGRVVSGALAHVPAVLEHLVEDLGGLEAAGELARHGARDRLVDLGQPVVRDDLLVVALTVGRGGVRVEVVEQAAGLVLADVEAGEAQQAAGVVAGVDDLRGDDDLGAADVGRHRQLVDVEAELVEPADALVDAPAVADLEALRAGEGVPQRVVALDDRRGHLEGVGVLLEEAAGREVHQLAGDVDPGDVEVVLALAVGQPARAARRSRRRRGRRRRRRRRGGRACWTATRRPTRSPRGAGARGARRGRP